MISFQLTCCYLIDDPAKSNTKSKASDDGPDRYGAQVDYITDDLSIEDCKLPQLRLGVAEQTVSLAGQLGLGTYNPNQDNASAMQNSTVLDAMVANGLINRHAYSLWLNTLESDKGNVVFGGVDTEKFEGDLKWINMSSTAPSPFASLVGMSFTLGEDTITSPGMTKRQASSDAEDVTSRATQTDEASASDTTDPSDGLSEALDFGALLITFSTRNFVSMIPHSLFDLLAELFGAVQMGASGLYTVPCSSEEEGSIDFQFDNLEDGPVIKVPFSELAFPLPEWLQAGSDGINLEDGEKTATCGFGLSPLATEGMMLLGQTFLRSAYIAFDHDDMTVGLANARWNVTDSNIVEMTSEGLGLAVTSSAASASAASSVANDKPESGETGTMTVSATSVVQTSPPGDGKTASTSSGGDRTFTQSAESNSSSAAAAAPAVVGQSNAHFVLLVLCGSIMLVAAVLL